MAEKINFATKIGTNQRGNHINQVWDIDMNETKTVVNANADELDAKTGDIAANTANIATNSNNITANAGDIAVNEGNVAANSTLIDTNISGIATNVTNISTNSSGIVNNTSSINDNTNAIGVNAGNITANANDITTNEAAITANALSISTLETDTGDNSTQIDINTGKIATNAANISTNTSGIATNANNISDNDFAIGTNTTAISNNVTNIGTNASDIATNVTNIGTNASGVSANAGNISTNSTDISTNTTNIGTNATDIATNVTNIGANTTLINTNITDIANNTVAIGDNTDDIAVLSQTATTLLKSGSITNSRSLALTDINGINEVESAADVEINILPNASLDVINNAVAAYIQKGEGNIIINYDGTYIGQTFSKNQSISVWQDGLDNWVILNRNFVKQSTKYKLAATNTERTEVDRAVGSRLIGEVRAFLNTADTTTDVVVDVLVNGVSTTSSMATITAGDLFGSSKSFLSGNGFYVYDNDEISFDVSGVTDATGLSVQLIDLDGNYISITNIYTLANAANPENEVNSIAELSTVTVGVAGTCTWTSSNIPTPDDSNYCLTLTHNGPTGTVRGITDALPVVSGATYRITARCYEISGIHWQIHLTDFYGWEVGVEVNINSQQAWSDVIIEGVADGSLAYLAFGTTSSGAAGEQLAISSIDMRRIL